MSYRLDVAAIERLRNERGLTRKELAAALALSPTSIRSLEDGTNHDRLKLQLLGRLADTLGHDLRALLIPAGDEAGATYETSDVPDDVKLEAVLASADRGLKRSELCKALNMDLRRVDRTLKTLRARLKGTGQRLHRLGDRSYRLRPYEEALSSTELDAMVRTTARRDGLRRDEAELLHRILHRQLPAHWDRHVNADKRMRMGALLKQGLVRRAGDRYELTDHAREVLLLDQPRRRTNRPRRKTSVKARR